MPRPELDHLALLVGLQDEFAATIPLVDPATPIPWLPRWRVSNLVVHLARIHHWAAAQARRQQETPLGRGPFVLDEFYAEYAKELRDTLAELGPDAVSWTLVGNGPASWWRRRQLHETLVHLHDLRAPVGLPVEVAPQVWADTVDEVVTVMQPRQVRLDRMAALPQRIALVADDAGAGWVFEAAETAGHETAVTVRGPARSLALLLWGRLRADDEALAVEGDRELLDDALGRRLTP